ncbi:shikimate kinase [Ruminococcus flavefaciens]|uniref:Shikimate kinase n=1 Tax=Ruminococcus flavefaciens TaxID=1265 RepID=A0A315Y740_RUMFL|nr:shikimate kinase [Ruminococcus flavefaciens]PWJ15264.1 shikimate kinase [Ruminococcus flavefaciens]SSA40310.1 shikimate kinase [Ruminococcus flavefaciens]
MHKNIILIGMPGVGKSTVGVILAKLLGYSFVDTDLVIQKKEKKLLKDIIAEKGIDGFIETENRILSSFSADNSVIATGGSVVYGKEAMANLSDESVVVYLKLDYNKLRYRLGNIKNRGVVIRKGQSLNALYKERVPLYEKYADIVIDENGCNIEKTVNKIMAELQNSL